jgi:hypothetical protein
MEESTWAVSKLVTSMVLALLQMLKVSPKMVFGKMAREQNGSKISTLFD